MLSRSFLLSLSGCLIATAVLGVLADDPVREDRIKVFLFASPAYFADSAVDVYKDACTSLAGTLIDGKVSSFLVGGRDIPTVLNRTDDWYCIFYDNYNCSGDEDDDETLVFADGVNNLESVGWEGNIHSVECHIENDGYST
ncbi:hypothetical protein CC78DRAFT_587866 [Lojkania enalia]|uniref:Uncharacterized protein n=1 Tax=Lojkania enalia TaxID=147567 RepID=A0A9P4MUI5_9PLEO|nr:hypothetical protein CC78DRAFT_587866 [Didymosphaeria enalia]